MKYFVRAVKYFFYFSIMFVIIVSILVLIGAAEGDISTMFAGGTSALWKIAALFAAVSAIYPSVGFIRKESSFPGEWNSVKGDIIRHMESRSYVAEEENGTSLVFRKKGFMSKLSRMFEDRITISPCFGGAVIEGMRKDAIRISAGLEHVLNRDSDTRE